MELTSINRRTAILKLISIVLLVLLTISVIMAWNSPATGYEASIYSSTPLLLWITVTLAFVFVIFVLLYTIRDDRPMTIVKLCLPLFIISYTVITAVFLIRSYYMWNLGGDAATHLLHIDYILNNGSIMASLFYPIFHIYVATINYYTGINVNYLSKLVPFLFGVLYIPFIYVFCKAILKDEKISLLATITGCIFVNVSYTGFAPNNLGNLLFPLAVYIFIKYFKTHQIEWGLLSLLVVVLYPPLHIIPTFALFIILVTYIAYNVYSNRHIRNIDKFSILFAILLLIWSIYWISSFYIWKGTISSIVDTIMNGGDTYLTGLGNNISYTQKNGYNVIEYISKTIGGTIVYIFIALILLPLIAYWSRNSFRKHVDIPVLYVTILLLLLMTVILFFLNLVFGPLRLMFYICILCSPLIVYATVVLTRKFNVKLYQAVLAIFGLLLVILFINGLLSFYPSPYIWASNAQDTKSEVNSMSWFYHNKNLDMDTGAIIINPIRYAHFILTVDELKSNNIPTYFVAKKDLPYHFGYANGTHLAYYYASDTYVITSELDISYYRDIFPAMAAKRFNNTDYELINWDNSIYRIYDNDEVKLWYVKVQG